MRYSHSYIPTLKEVPADAEAISHKLLLRAGLIRRLSSGVYSYLPLGLTALRLVEDIVRTEMNKAGFAEVLLPAVQPAELWQESGRWDYYGRELLRFVDRHDHASCLGPTHEEVITDLVRGEVNSYRQLPVRLYQIQTKFRDELRPRFGLLRGREFVMKDAYSFDIDPDASAKSYELMHKAYIAVFRNLGLKFCVVEADSGAIGGNFSHEFMVLAQSGEDTICVCPNCGYAANIEHADIHCEITGYTNACPSLEKVETPKSHTVEEVCKLLEVTPQQIIKTLILLADNKPVAALVRGDRQLNEVKLKNYLKVQNLTLADAKTVKEVSQAPLGFAGPVGLTVPIYADLELQNATDYIAGANAKDAHYKHLDLKRDSTITAWVDLRDIVENDPCPHCQKPVELHKGIEVGHIFRLGTKYSKAMHAVFLDATGKECPLVMGCYGIGVSRVLAAAIEQNYDEHGIIFPWAIAPAQYHIICLDPNDATTMQKAEAIYQQVSNLGRVLFDDRVERPGSKFKDADLLGAPIQLIIGNKGLARNVIECKIRHSNARLDLPLENFLPELQKLTESVKEYWQNKALLLNKE